MPTLILSVIVLVIPVFFLLVYTASRYHKRAADRNDDKNASAQRNPTQQPFAFMKLKIILALSILLNVGLAAAYLAKNKPLPTTPALGETLPSPGKEKTFVKTRVVTNTVANTGTNSVVDWRAVESEDYRRYIANLRSIGCPEETIRDIIIADVNKLFEARRAAANTSTNRFEYWKGGNPLAAMFDEKKIAHAQELAAEKKALLKELLGVEITEKADLIGGADLFATMLDFLPAEKQSQLMEMEQKFAARLMKTMKDAAQGDATAMRAVQAEKDAELLRLLGPKDKFEYDLRMSQSSMMMRMQMTDFQPKEEEFRQMFQLRKAFDDQYSPLGAASSDPKDQAARRAAEKELNAQTRQLLGDERYNEYRYDQDWAKSSLKNVAKDFNIPKETAFKVFDLKTTAQEQAQQVRANSALSAEQQQEALRGIRDATEQAVGDVLGKPAADAYIKKGSWIKNLSQQRSGGNNE